MTDAEKILWAALRNRQLAGCKFRRQWTIGQYIADFACLEAMLIVEADGGQHGRERDAVRTMVLEAAGFFVLRFWNNDIFENRAGVLEAIGAAVVERAASGRR